jgi:hypothetical protein
MSDGARDNDRTSSGSAPSPSGPLQRRLQRGAQPLGTQVAEPTAAGAQLSGSEVDQAESLGHATLSLLDGTVIARMPCSDDLGSAVIGRGSLSDIRIHDPWIHREHAHVSWDAESRAHLIADAGGANGTFVNLQRLASMTPVRLTDGARVRVGKTELIYRRVRS